MDKLKFFLNIFGFTEVIDGGSFSRPTFLSPFKKYSTFRALQNSKRYKICKHYKLYYSAFLSSSFHILYTISENFVGFCISIGRYVYFGAEAYLCEIGGFRAFFWVDLR